MNKTQEQLEKLREVAEASLTKTEELHKVLAQIEALMSREESPRRTASLSKTILILLSDIYFFIMERKVIKILMIVLCTHL